MTISRLEALATARKLCRSLVSAPLPQDRAKALFQTLARADGWSAVEQQAILELGVWLETRPAPSQLKPRCEDLLGRL